jgi:4-hydroxythreonine-4-phosphate dehydrogenase
MKNKIIILTGDPNSINSEIIAKSWQKLNVKIRKKILLIGNYKLINSQFRKINKNIKLIEVKSLNENTLPNCLKIIDIPINFTNPFNVALKSSSKYVSKSLNFAHKLCLEKKIKGFINCPIDKRLIKSKKIHGVTEFLARKSNLSSSSEVMMMHNKKLSVVPITTHIRLKDVSNNISKNKIIQKLNTLNKEFKRLFKRKPKIAILGMNPHNNELSNKSEEVTKIIPAIKKLKNSGLNVDGPIVSDTIFIQDYKKYDIVVGMYHDQVLIPFKTLFKFDAINITLGLSYTRVSPDHGTAVNLIKKNEANCLSLLQCIKFINTLN